MRSSFMYAQVSSFFVYYYSLFHHVSLLLSTFSIVVLTYVIMKASTKSMGSYKWLLLNEAMWNFALELVLSGYQFVTIFPAYCGYSAASIFRHNSSNFLSQIALMLLVICAIGKIHSMVITFLNRLAYALSNRDDIYTIYTTLTPWAQIFSLVFFVILVVPVTYLSNSYLIKSQLYTISVNKYAEPIIQSEPTVVCFMDSDKDVIMLVLCIIILTVSLGCLGLLIFANRVIKESEHQVMPTTYKMQWMLFKSCIAQYFAAFFWLIIPFFLFAICAIFSFPYRNHLVCLAICMATTHSFVDSLIVLWFIRPYKEYIRRALGLETPKKSTPATSITEMQNFGVAEKSK